MNISENMSSEKVSQGSFCSMLSSRDWENSLLSQVIHETIQKTTVDGKIPTSNHFRIQRNMDPFKRDFCLKEWVENIVPSTS